MAVYDIRENDNTVTYNKKHGDWIINDSTGTATQINAWVFTRQP